MNKYFNDVLNNKEDNYILPFFWPYENHNETIATEIAKIYESGCRAFCIEARPFEDYGKDNWWSAVELMLEEATKRNMKVWILDDKRFPTGYANGLIEKKYPERGRRYLREHHIDLMGPQKEMTVLIPPCLEGETILSACMWKRSGNKEELCGEPIKLDIKENSDMLFVDVPDGCWRIFIIYNSPFGAPGDHRWFINMLSDKSVDVLIEAVYEEHYKHFSKYFGNTIAGFFSDEPSFGAEHMGNWGSDGLFYYRTVGKPSTAMPWDSSVLELMEQNGIKDTLLYLPALWWDAKEKSSEIRLEYMNAITRLWNKNFSYKIGNWCREHGVEYIGHIIEDMNAHSRIGGSAGHYFRALSGQDMAGIDIVLHQIMPGMGDYYSSSISAGGVADPAFYNYVLPNLASSLSRIEPHMKGRAMCEVFGAYGWAEGAPFMKWLIDFLLVRGINHFVPHAFSAKPDNDDCPPHFYSNGKNSQYEGFSAVMKYANKVSHLLSNFERKVSGAIFYYAENEWMSGEDFMYCDAPAKVLYDAKIDYDIIPLDALQNAEFKNEKLYVNGYEHTFFVLPQAKNIPAELKECLVKMENAGIPIFVVYNDEVKYNCPFGKEINIDSLVSEVFKADLAHRYGKEHSLLRVGHFKNDANEYYMIFNEEPFDVCENIQLLSKGDYISADLLTGGIYKNRTDDGIININLKAGQSVILVFGDMDFDGFSEEKKSLSSESPKILWNISLKDSESLEFELYKEKSELINITSMENKPDFSGYILYEGKIALGKTDYILDLGAVGQTAKLYINGNDLGIRVCAPYMWDISQYAKKGENEIKIIVANTLVNRKKDVFSHFMPIPPSGVIGPIALTELSK